MAKSIPRGAVTVRAPAAGAGAKGPARPVNPVTLDTDEDSPEHREFPRARLSVPFHLWIGEGKDRTFSAALKSVNLSVSGAFLESTFFVPVGTQLSVSFQLEDDGEPVRARAEVVREERGREEARSGMGLRFVEFYGQTEVTLARLFLGEALRQFAEQYLDSDRAQSLSSELERVVDALAAWELQKVTRPGGDPWSGKSLGPVEKGPAEKPGREDKKERSRKR